VVNYFDKESPRAARVGMLLFGLANVARWQLASKLLFKRGNMAFNVIEGLSPRPTSLWCSSRAAASRFNHNSPLFPFCFRFRFLSLVFPIMVSFSKDLFLFLP
jgi:hypothetical protein